MAYMWSILGNVPRVLEKNVNSAVGGGFLIALLLHLLFSCSVVSDSL